ncbi:DEAD/DEAH box helicase family protein [Pseudooceanicola nanhaiensis]|uniref:DEAD/DEAH box helicase family protein n=1 Tax=Pseudooceanicola nanhaiensis TaxID=375761 RepID=UPI001CD6AC1B|nr:DEAD/DEAH box helicase family protein [Pseudooceanicola nanhaiensis]MCA0920233.1 hypothetical protein [Pseudooceanicola nanhaiensis]
MFYKISGSVGSGKTQAVLEHIRDNLGVGYILVAPTIMLCEEVYKRALKVLVNHPEYINNGPLRLIVTDEQKDEGVYQRAVKACDDFDDATPPIIILTTKTFEYLVDHLQDHFKARFDVFIDEGLPPIRLVRFAPGDKSSYLDFLSINENHLATPANGKREILEWAAFTPNKLYGQQLDHLNTAPFRDIAELVLSPHFDAFLWETDKSIEVIGVFSPQKLLPFRSITLVVAIFERTLLPLLWEKRYGISFENSPAAANLFDAHTAKGAQMAVWHVLCEGDLPSKNNLERNFETHETNEPDPRKQVIFEAARQINARFPDGAYCWAANTSFKNTDSVLEGKRMPANSSGLNEYKNFDTVVSLVCINPPPWAKHRMLELFDLDQDQLYELWRFSHTYQTIGRCSLRVRERENPINVVVTSSFCADQVLNLFEGATKKGQITNLPRLSKLAHHEKVTLGIGINYTKQDNTAYSKYRSRLKKKGQEPMEKHEWYEEHRKPQLAKKG